MEYWQPTAQVDPQIGIFGLRGGLGDRTWAPTAAVDPRIGIYGGRGVGDLNWEPTAKVDPRIGIFGRSGFGHSGTSLGAPPPAGLPQNQAVPGFFAQNPWFLPVAAGALVLIAFGLLRR